MNAELQALRHNRPVVVAAIVAAIAVAVFAVVGTAHLLGWIPREGPAAAAPAPAPAVAPVARAPAIDLLPGESLVAETAPAGEPSTPARPDPMFPRYGAPAAPLPAPPASDATRPTGVPRNPYLASGPRPAPVPPAARPEPVPPPREELSRAEIRPRDRLASEESQARDEPRRRNNLCNNCAVVTAVSQYVGEWEVHLRFSDGSRRKILYTTPPPVSRGDRIVIENGRLFLDN